MFVFMVHPERIIDLNGSGGLMRGFFLWNSEVGAGAFKIQTFLLEAVCGNHIVWGASDVKTYRKVHKGQDFDDLGRLQASPDRTRLGLCRRGYIGRDADGPPGTGSRSSARQGRDDQEPRRHAPTGAVPAGHRGVLFRRGDAEGTAKAPPTTAWGLVHGLTRYSQATPYADQRAALDTAAGKLLALTAN